MPALRLQEGEPHQPPPIGRGPALPLTRAGVEHDAHAGAEGLRRDVVAELGAHNARVAVRARDAAPDDADLGAADLLLCAVHEGDAL
jgi:hypothetical protein